MHRLANTFVSYHSNVKQWCGVAVLVALTLGIVMDGVAQNEPVRGAHEDLEPGARTDDLGITVPIAADFSARRYPASDDFPTGPAVGERLPDFKLPNQHGDFVDYHADRADSKSIVVFYRSAVW